MANQHLYANPVAIEMIRTALAMLAVEPNRLITTAAAAKMLGIKPVSVRSLILTGKLHRYEWSKVDAREVELLIAKRLQSKAHRASKPQDTRPSRHKGNGGK